MSYTVQYGSYKYDRKVTMGKKYTVWLAVGIMLAICVAMFAFPKQTAGVRDIVFPFLKEDVRSAFGQMVTQIGEGTSISDAAAAFCREILVENAH